MFTGSSSLLIDGNINIVPHCGLFYRHRLLHHQLQPIYLPFSHSSDAHTIPIAQRPSSEHYLLAPAWHASSNWSTIIVTHRQLIGLNLKRHPQVYLFSAYQLSNIRVGEYTRHLIYVNWPETTYRPRTFIYLRHDALHNTLYQPTLSPRRPYFYLYRSWRHRWPIKARRRHWTTRYSSPRMG